MKCTNKDKEITVYEVERLIHKIEINKWQEELSHKVDRHVVAVVLKGLPYYRKPYDYFIQELNKLIPSYIKEEVEYLRSWLNDSKRSSKDDIRVKIKDLLLNVLDTKILIPKDLINDLRYYSWI